MTRWRRLLALLAAALLLCVALPGTAHADDGPPSSWHIVKHDTTIDVDEHGVGKAVTTIVFDFADHKGHGPFVVFTGRTLVANEPDLWRMTPVTIDEVTSPSGAPTDQLVEQEPAGLKLRIGREDYEVWGKHTYVIKYTVGGLVEPNQKDSHLDEFNWSVVGTGWQIPIDEATATVTVPGPVKLAKCFQGRKFNQPCEASAEKGFGGSTTVHYRARGLDDGHGMQVVAGSPAGTYPDVVVEKTKRYHWGNTFGGNPVAALVGALLAALGCGGLVRRTRRLDDHDVVTAVRFTPPDDMRPGEAGHLLDGHADARDVIATIVDLSVRGHLRIESTGKKDHRFTRLDGPADLADYEAKLLDTFFGDQRILTTDEMGKQERFAGFMETQRHALASRAKKRGWWTNDPSAVLVGVVFSGIFGLALIAIACLVAARYGWGMLPLLLVIPVILLLVLCRRFGRRSEQGRQKLQEVKGFRLYLETAEANQIRFEEGIDVFSRYLPWAIAFDVAERWVKVFQQLAAEGRYDMSGAVWYAGGTDFGMSSFDGLSSIDSAMSSSLSAASSSSSGGSGGGGGGGFGGGGGGGW